MNLPPDANERTSGHAMSRTRAAIYTAVVFAVVMMAGDRIEAIHVWLFGR